MSQEQECELCKKTDEYLKAKLTKKGCDSLLNISKGKDDGLDVKPGQYVHEECRKEYSRKKNLKDVRTDTGTDTLNSAKRSLEEECELCKKKDYNPKAKLTQKGCDSLMVISKGKGDGLDVKPGHYVHEDCRKEYSRKRKLIDVTNDTLSSPKTRKTAGGAFLYESNCVLCGTYAEQNENSMDEDSDIVHRVETFEFQITIRDLCMKRNDEWAKAILCRLECVHDLPAAEALYHQSCSSNFRTGRHVPVQYRSSNNVKTPKGRPSNASSQKAFLETMEHFENHENEQLSVSDLVKTMTEKCGNDAYSTVYMKRKISEYFGDTVIISELEGKHDVITFKSEAHAILHSFYKRSKSDGCASDKEMIIKTASRLICNDIKSLEKCKDFYPRASEITSLGSNLEYVPDSLQIFLDKIIDKKSGEKKIASIGQAIVQAAVPRCVICPLQIGLGVQVHHVVGSKMLVDCLNSVGFCSSYHDVMKFEKSAAVTHGLDLQTVNNEFVQFVADNVDHNICTIDGLNTFHGMGIIATATPKLERSQVIPRINVTRDEVIETGKIEIKFYSQKYNNMEQMVFKQLKEISVDDDHESRIEFILKIARPLKVQLPGWSGAMQMLQKGYYPGPSSVVFMPMIDMSSSDLSCIYSTLHFVAKQSRKVNTAAVLTFDQPLYWKALNIIVNEPQDSDIKSIVLRLGGFHSEMSFLGCIGRLMQNSGLKELLSTVYAENTVVHMLDGKAVNRAIRGHFLVDDALNSLLLENVVNKVNSSDGDIKSGEIEHFDVSELTKVQDIVKETVDEKCIPDSIADIEVKHMVSKFNSLKANLMEFRTARLWLQYMEMVDNLKVFIKAERMGDWNLHLKSLQNMLPFFAAAGHNNYVKSAYVYLQEMMDLPERKPEVYQAFMSGLHVIRRSDRFWGGLSSDLVIEQVLMRTVKSAGGLTRGRGMTEAQRAQWLLSVPAMAEINHAMQEFTNQDSHANGQHKEASKSRLERDSKDRDILLEFLRQRNPFTAEASLRNIETGVIGDETVTADTAKDVGKDILDSMKHQSVSTFSFKRKNEAVTLATRSNAKQGVTETNDVDPQVLFQRLITVSDTTVDDTEGMFKYELCGNPSSLFESARLLREAHKPAIAKAIRNQGCCDTDEILDENIQYVLDGGSLIQRIPWKFGASFDCICESYTDFVEKNYGKACVVFDGYACGQSTKDVTHERRSKGIVGVEIKFDGRTPFTTRKDSVLLNLRNKQRFINLLGTHMQARDIKVKHAYSDADVLIALTAIEMSEIAPTVVIGEDTDLLILLCYHATAGNKLYFKSDSKNMKEMKIWDINKTRTLLTKDVCDQLPFIHAFSGCDTTSRIHGIGKGTVFKKGLTDHFLREQGYVFLNKDSSQDDVESAGEKTFKCIYNGNMDESLDKLRYRKFVTKATTSKSIIQVETLPPTQAAAKYHSLRVYHQVQTWIGNELDPLQWGWTSVENKLMPLKTDLPAAPERLLQLIKCNCKSNCDSKRCSCRKHGLHCSSACGGCRGTGCSNSIPIDTDDLDQDN